MERLSEKKIIFDTSALISLQSIGILKNILSCFCAITTESVIKELEQFSIHDDYLGNVAKEVLAFKPEFLIEKVFMNEKIRYLHSTDNELYNLALNEEIPLVSDDHKISHHTENKIIVYYSTFFLIFLVEAKIVLKKEASDYLELLRDIRNWRSNIIYTSTKKELGEM